MDDDGEHCRSLFGERVYGGDEVFKFERAIVPLAVDEESGRSIDAAARTAEEIVSDPGGVLPGGEGVAEIGDGEAQCLGQLKQRGQA